MPSKLQYLADKGYISPPKWLETNVCYETIMGSMAYGVSSDTSDMDIYGFGIPPRDMVFPHLSGEIRGFGPQQPIFEQYQKHHIEDKDALGGKGREYDLVVYNIVKYFNLCMNCNPNMIDSLFTPQTCVVHSTYVGSLVRDNRKLFLSKKAWAPFKDYAYSQLHAISSKEFIKIAKKTREFEKKYNISHYTSLEEIKDEMAHRPYSSETVRALAVLTDEALAEYASLMENRNKTNRFQAAKEQGTDTKYLYHLIRLLDEIEQILIFGDIDLQRNKEQLKAIRRGEMTEEEVVAVASEKEKYLEKLYIESKLREIPEFDALKELLLNCLEEHYGSLENVFVNPNAEKVALKQIQDILDKLRTDNTVNKPSVFQKIKSIF